MSGTDGHNGYFGLKEFYIAPVISEESHTYETPFDVGSLGGIMELTANAQTSSDTVYASDKPWIDSEVDNGFDGTARLANVWGDPTLRQKFAPLCGYEFAADGTLLGSSTKPRKKFALLTEPSGNVSNKRLCYLLCQFGKPGKSAQSKGESGNHVADEFPLTARPVTLASGWTGSFYENLPSDGTPYTNFYQAVRTDLAASESADVSLASLAIGTLELAPAFDANTTTYTATTTASSDAVSAAATDGDATVSIIVNGAAHTSGNSATWDAGKNYVTVLVSNGGSVKAYTVVVTKSATQG